MLRDVISVQHVRGYVIHVRFDEGTEGEIDLSSSLSFTGVFAGLRDPALFAAVRVHPELHVICWPNGADYDSEALYALVRGEPVPDLEHAHDATETTAS